MSIFDDNITNTDDIVEQFYRLRKTVYGWNKLESRHGDGFLYPIDELWNIYIYDLYHLDRDMCVMERFDDVINFFEEENNYFKHIFENILKHEKTIIKISYKGEMYYSKSLLVPLFSKFDEVLLTEFRNKK